MSQDSQPRTELVLPVKPGDHIEVPYHAHLSGHDTVRLQVERVGPAFRWSFGDLWQEISGVPIDESGVPCSMMRKVTTVRVRMVRRLERRR